MFHILAPAKINLFLHVTGRRADGYHTLQSLFAFADTGDTLSFTSADTFTLDITGPFARDVPRDGNIIHTAANALARHFARPLHARITLEKNLPIASGIGGGSADAAATLRGLSRLWQLPVDHHTLHDIAVTLGADVPACLHTAPLWVEGVGEKILPVQHLPHTHVVLVNPRVPTATPDVFRHFSQSFSPPVTIPDDEWIAFLRDQRNDLTAAAITVTPVIQDVLETLSGTNPMLHRLSGSGATCFALYPTADDAMTAAANIRHAKPAWWVTTAALYHQ